MPNTIANRQAICTVLMEHAKTDKDIVVVCSDSRGSASLAPFFDAYPQQSVEVGIAEQDLVGIAAGLASCGKKPYAASPASFVSTRSYEQAKVDCAYSNTNVKLIGISGGISYGALGMSHHSAQDIAAMSAIPNMRVYLPSDHVQTAKLFEALLKDDKPAYIRVGRNPVEDIYTEDNCPFVMDKATVLCEGNDVAIIATGELVKPAFDAAALLREQGLSATVLDMYCVKPLDAEAVIAAAKRPLLCSRQKNTAPTAGLALALHRSSLNTVRVWSKISPFPMPPSSQALHLRSLLTTVSTPRASQNLRLTFLPAQEPLSTSRRVRNPQPTP
jgi:transketolase